MMDGDIRQNVYDDGSKDTLTDEQRTCISEIVEYMRHSREEFARLIEPGDTTFVVDHWELGLSELGSDGTDGTALLH